MRKTRGGEKKSWRVGRDPRVTYNKSGKGGTSSAWSNSEAVPMRIAAQISWICREANYPTGGIRATLALAGLNLDLHGLTSDF